MIREEMILNRQERIQINGHRSKHGNFISDVIREEMIQRERLKLLLFGFGVNLYIVWISTSNNY
jgi:hypothetical protein